MSFQRPTLPDLVTRIQADFVSRLNFVGAILRRAVVYVLSRVLAGAAHMMHGHLEFLGDQLFPDRSQDEFLVRQAGLFGFTQNPPTFARYAIALTGTNGSIALTGALLSSSAGFEYTIDTGATISAGVASVNVTAVLAGSESNLIVGAVLEFESPISGIDVTATVTAVIVDGQDVETIDSLRARFVARLAEPSMGGNDADYVEWAEQVTGVTRVWPIRLGLGPGTVLAYFVRDNDGAGAAIIPDSGEVAAVQAVFDVNAPSHCTATAAAPVDAPLNVTVHLVPNTGAAQAAVQAALVDMFFRTSSPLAVSTLISSVRTAIGDAMREIAGDTGDYTLSSPTVDTAHTTGQLARLGTLTFT